MTEAHPTKSLLIFPSKIVCTVAAALLMLAPAASLADEAYLFVRMECHPESKSVFIHVFLENNEAGRALLKHPGKDIYSVVDDNVRTCDLGDGQAVGVGPSYTVPIGNAQYIDIGSSNMGIMGLPGMYRLNSNDPWDVDITPIGNGNFSGRYCSNDKINFKPKIQKQFAVQFKKNKRICEVTEGGPKTYTLKSVYVDDDK